MLHINRKLIRTNEKSISVIQLLGALLLVTGVAYLLIWGLICDRLDPDKVAIAFFLVMMGMALAFPELLEDQNNGLSTMRITVFMFTAVTGMLLLKIGWGREITSLEDIGLNQYWVGLFAFLFGAKATQSFFESRMAEHTAAKENETNTSTDSNLQNAPPEIIEEAIDRKGLEWINSFPNVTGLSVDKKTTGSEELDIWALIFKVEQKPDSNALQFGYIPKGIIYQAINGKKYNIPTDVRAESTPVTSLLAIDEQPFPIGNSISREFDSKTTGSIGLVLNKGADKETLYLIGCYHVLCYPEFQKKQHSFSAGAQDSQRIRCASFQDNGTNMPGQVIQGDFNEQSDFAIAQIQPGIDFSNNFYGRNISPAGFDVVLSSDRGSTVKLAGRSSVYAEGIIKSHRAPRLIKYPDGKQYYLSKLIELEKISEGGDSGGPVLNADNKVIGLLVATGQDSSYVLPVRDYILENNYLLK